MLSKKLARFPKTHHLPPPPQPKRIYHARTYFHEKRGIFSMGGANSPNQESFSKFSCSVEGYWGSLDRSHGVLTDICDDHVIWWPRRGWTEWIRNLCTVFMTNNDLCTCIALTKWDGPIVCVNVTENVENFILLPQPKPLWEYRWSNMNMTVTLALFLLISKK